MRKLAAGLGSLVVAAGLTTTFALSAGAAPGDGSARAQSQQVADDMPNAAEEKRRELREVAIKKVIAGDAKVQQRGASKVVKVGRTTAAKGQPAEDQYVELAREKTDKIFVVLAEFGNERHPSYPDQDTDPNIAGSGPLRRAAAQPDPGARPLEGQQDDLADRTTTGRTTRSSTSGPAPTTTRSRSGTSASRPAATASTAQVTDWVKVRYNEARYGRSNGFPCAGTSAATPSS